MKTRTGKMMVMIVFTGLISLPLVYAQGAGEYREEDRGAVYQGSERCGSRFGGPRGGQMGHRLKTDSAGDLIAQLALTSEQQGLLKTQRETQREASRELSEMSRNKRRELQQELEKADTDMARVEALISEIADLQTRLVRKRVENIIQIKSVLTPEQFKKFTLLRKRRGMQGKRQNRYKRGGNRQRERREMQKPLFGPEEESER